MEMVCTANYRIKHKLERESRWNKGSLFGGSIPTWVTEYKHKRRKRRTIFLETKPRRVLAWKSEHTCEMLAGSCGPGRRITMNGSSSLLSNPHHLAQTPNSISIPHGDLKWILMVSSSLARRAHTLPDWFPPAFGSPTISSSSTKKRQSRDELRETCQ